MAKNKFRIIDELIEKGKEMDLQEGKGDWSRYLLVVLASKYAKVIAERKQEHELAARLGIPDEDVKPTIVALYKMLREGWDYIEEEGEEREKHIEE
ncbi:MAG TPA: DNA-directed RNA polymerase subunit omega [Candidatus Hydrothermia bacterium]|nr:DNA-directed RNA polymerase subunit omega [Candidatus Hydrothermae bacterium]MDD3649469.1 DNA-directed RNA polymerase subunit omega [Candidatus Hydrothermia bacterium]MDD5572842.1 DNA-directed RNA polymerase subunit omega [Candidatus Hydrothermia bacterium]HOK22812.1 DNA-directed RNA polymerase subunit omega [Candidatus Hydrothermia bacterium]HOL23521.1 DNA-directed RNA polymerase subunit omega [Candidatus Hydrothermia bacterium]